MYTGKGLRNSRIRGSIPGGAGIRLSFTASRPARGHSKPLPQWLLRELILSVKWLKYYADEWTDLHTQHMSSWSVTICTERTLVTTCIARLRERKAVHVHIMKARVWMKKYLGNSRRLINGQLHAPAALPPPGHEFPTLFEYKAALAPTKTLITTADYHTAWAQYSLPFMNFQNSPPTTRANVTSLRLP